MMWIDDPLVRVRPLTPDRYVELHDLEQRAEREGLWRFGGPTPDLDAYVPTLWANVSGQCALYHRDGRLLGTVTVHDTDLRSGTAWFAALVADDVRGHGIALAGIGQVITDLFRNWPLRRVCAEVLEPNLGYFAAALDRFTTELGRLRGHQLVGDRPTDVVLLGIERDTWRREAEPWLLRRRPPSGLPEGTRVPTRPWPAG
jgi:RimJ/RimL family protein N-acetyltransferase